MFKSAARKEGEVTIFLLDIVTTTGGLITMSLTWEEALASLGETLRESKSLCEYLDPDNSTPGALTDKSVLRAALVRAYGEDLRRASVVVGHDDEGASWAVRTKEIVAIRVVDPDMVPKPPTPRQIGFAARRSAAGSAQRGSSD